MNKIATVLDVSEYLYMIAEDIRLNRIFRESVDYLYSPLVGDTDYVSISIVTIPGIIPGIQYCTLHAHLLSTGIFSRICAANRKEAPILIDKWNTREENWREVYV